MKRMMQRQEAIDAADSGAGSDIDGAGVDASRTRRSADSGSTGDHQGLPERTGEYLREVRGELQKVAWPGRTEVVNYTIVVLVAVVLLTLFVFGVDIGVAKAVIQLFPK
jgi:preprotein translocase subunit SecE